MKLNVTRAECDAFEGGYAVKDEAMFAALGAVEWHDTPLWILEFGSGTGTLALCKLLDEKQISFRYISYENQPKWVQHHNRLFTWEYTDFPEWTIPGQFDLIIIDGPNDVSRKNWYPLIRHNVRPGTILHIDDYDHFPDFAEALNANFTYDEVDRREGGHTCWRTVRITGIKPQAEP